MDFQKVSCFFAFLAIGVLAVPTPDSVTSGSVWRAEAGDDKRAVAEDEAWMYVKMGTRDASEGNGASRYYSRDERSVERGAPAHIERAAAEEDEPWLYIKIGSRDAPEGNEA